MMTLSANSLEGTLQFLKTQEAVAAVVFPDDGAVVGEEGEEGAVVAEELIVGAEGKVELAVGGGEVLEYLAVEGLVLLQHGLCLGGAAQRLGENAAEGAEDVAHGVDAPHGTMVELRAAEGVVSSHAAAYEHVGALVGDERLQPLV